MPHVIRAVKAMRAMTGQIPIFMSIPSSSCDPVPPDALMNASLSAWATAAKLDAFRPASNLGCKKGVHSNQPWGMAPKGDPMTNARPDTGRWPRGGCGSGCLEGLLEAYCFGAAPFLPADLDCPFDFGAADRRLLEEGRVAPG